MRHIGEIELRVWKPGRAKIWTPAGPVLPQIDRLQFHCRGRDSGSPTRELAAGLHSFFSSLGTPKKPYPTSDNVRYVRLIIKKAGFLRGKIRRLGQH